MTVPAGRGRGNFPPSLKHLTKREFSGSDKKNLGKIRKFKVASRNYFGKK